MLTIAALLSPRRVQEPVIRVLGAGPLAELMAAARADLRRDGVSREAPLSIVAQPATTGRRP